VLFAEQIKLVSDESMQLFRSILGEQDKGVTMIATNNGKQGGRKDDDYGVLSGSTRKQE